MRRVKNFTITEESLEEQVRNSRYNPCLEITFRDRIGRHKHKISAGYTDEIHVFRDYGQTLVLSFNLKLGYVGMETFEGDKKINSVFLRSSEMLAAFGKDDFKPSKMAGILSELL